MASKHLILVLGLLTVDAMIACDSPLNSGFSTLGTGGSGPAVDAAASRGDAAADGATDAATLLPAPVLDPTGTYGGKTYAEWGGAWWKWLMELPGPDFPVIDSTGAFCALGQSEAADGGTTQTDVFFLGDNMAAPAGGTATRACTIPSGRMLFVPMIEWWNDNSGVDAGLSTYMTDQEQQKWCSDAAAIVNALSLEIDGTSYGSKVSDFAAYLTTCTEFSYTIPNTPSNLYMHFCTDPACSTITGLVPKAFAGGYWVLLAPLPAGSHTIHLVASQLNGSYHYTSDVTYNLTVQ